MFMADVWTKKKRSEVMSLVRSRGNKDTELVLVRLFRQNGIGGWRRHSRCPESQTSPFADTG